eukprot:jgi/Bigna1/67511/fgenesh1_pg.4_\
MEGEGGGSSSITPEQIKILEHCCLEVQRDPSLLQKPEFKFFKLFITHMAPTLRSEDDNKEKVGEKKQIFDDGTGHQFANVGHDGEEVIMEDPGEFIYPDYVPIEIEEDPDAMKNPDKVRIGEFEDLPEIVPTNLNDDRMQAGNNLKQEAKTLYKDGKLDEAIEKYRESARQYPTASVLAEIARVLLDQKRPNSAILVAKKAFKISEDNAKAFKVIGKAYNMLGNYTGAIQYLLNGQRIDYDPITGEDEKYARARVWRNKKVEDHRKRYEQERDSANEAHMAKVKKWEKKKRQKEHEERKRKIFESGGDYGSGGGGYGGGMPGGGYGGGMPGGGYGGGMPGGMPGGGGGMPGGGGGMDGMAQQLMQDPELMQAMQNPATLAKLQQAMMDMQKGKMPTGD